MKIDHKQLEMAIARMKSLLLGYNDREKQMDIDISFTQEDPGSGSMVDCITLTATLPHKDMADEEGESTVTIEIYPASEKVEPRVTKIDSFKLKKSY